MLYNVQLLFASTIRYVKLKATSHNFQYRERNKLCSFIEKIVIVLSYLIDFVGLDLLRPDGKFLYAFCIIANFLQKSYSVFKDFSIFLQVVHCKAIVKTNQ